MSEPKKVMAEFYPTDIRTVDCFINVVLPSNQLQAVVLHLKDKLPDYNSDILESLILLNWIVRRILTELNVVVLDHEPNSDYEEFYEDHFDQVEKYFILRAVEKILEDKQFKPTMAQSMVSGDKILISFGATNVQRNKAKLQKQKDSLHG